MHDYPNDRLCAHRHRQGFTLIELSVVLAIIGILVGGVMGGQYMLRQTELQSVLIDLSKYKSAYNQFKDQYGGRPGDLTDATDYWGTDPNGCPVTTYSTAAATPKRETCNGDGDGIILSITGATYVEMLRSWQHLADAGLVEGIFSGTRGPYNANNTINGINVPASRVSGGGYTIRYYNHPTDASGYYIAVMNAIYFGGTSGSYNADPLLSAKELYTMDVKIDDGKPGQGSVLSGYNVASPDNCGTTAVSATAAYNISLKGRTKCSLLYKLEDL